MKNVQEFADSIVIDLVEQSGCYGHFPYQMFVRNLDDSTEMCALALSDFISCFHIVGKKLVARATSVFIALDFPARGDMVDDFVAVFAIENGTIEVFAITYDPGTGVKKGIVKTSQHLDAIKAQAIASLGNVYGVN